MVGIALTEFEIFCCMLDCMRPWGLPSTAFRRVPNISTLSWSCIIQKPARLHSHWEKGLALHKMYEVSGLMIGDAPYEEYVPSTEELQLLKKSDPLVYETYWEVPCHFHICGQATGWRSERVKQMSWVNYLFPGVNKIDPMTRLASGTDDEIFYRISASPAHTPPSLMRILSNQT